MSDLNQSDKRALWLLLLEKQKRAPPTKITNVADAAGSQAHLYSLANERAAIRVSSVCHFKSSVCC